MMKWTNIAKMALLAGAAGAVLASGWLRRRSSGILGSRERKEGSQSRSYSVLLPL